MTDELIIRINKNVCERHFIIVELYSDISNVKNFNDDECSLLAVNIYLLKFCFYSCSDHNKTLARPEDSLSRTSAHMPTNKMGLFELTFLLSHYCKPHLSIICKFRRVSFFSCIEQEDKTLYQILVCIVDGVTRLKSHITQ